MVKLNKNIFTALAVVCGIASPILAVKAEERRIKKGLKRSPKSYILPIAFTTASVGFIFLSGYFNNRELSKALAALAISEEGYRKYRDKVEEVFGDGSDCKIRNEILKDEIDHGAILANHDLCLNPEKGDTLYLDEFTKTFFWSNDVDVKNAEYHLNRNLQLRGDATVHEFLEFLGIKDIPKQVEKLSDSLGWCANVLIEDGITPWIDFEHVENETEDGTKYISIIYVWDPVLFDYDNCKWTYAHSKNGKIIFEPEERIMW